MLSHQRALAGALLLASFTPAASAQDAAPFREQDEVRGAWIDLATTAIRPMAWHPGGNLWAVNSHDSTVVEFAPDGTALRTVRVPWGPVSIAHRPADQGAGSMLVVCRNTACLVELDAGSGELLTLVPLGIEPADLLVHPTNGLAYVAVAGERAVFAIDVDAGELAARFAVPSLRPTFLALDGEDVLVAPMVSGNNSTVDTGPGVLDPGPGHVLDLEDPTIANVELRDHDLFRISGAKIEPVARDVAAVQFAVGVHPTTGQVWQLGTEANNKDRERRGEPAIRGDIVVNQLALSTLTPGTVVEPAVVVDLDDQDPATDGVQYDAARSVGQPYALAFGAGGEGYVCGLLSNNVVELDANGALVREWDVGGIPRGLLVDGDTLLVYAWNDNRIERYDLAQAQPTLLGTFDLGFDPTPAVRAEGRRLFFDGSHSLHGNASCASCHVETDADLLPWDLSNLPFDDKGPLVTQFMRGIEDLAPFHWRGERAGLIDFNGAFDGLLGGATLDEAEGGEFEAFQEYVFSLEQPANPNQDERRLVVDRGQFRRASGEFVPADAVAGQDTYFDHQVIPGIGSCATCHTMPTGTSNEIFLDEPDLDFARRSHFVVASYNGMWRKDQTTLERIQLRDGTWETRPTIGVGVSAAGLKDDVLDFTEIALFSATQQQRNDIAAFIQQLDSGLAPAVHKGFLLGGGSVSETKAVLLRLKDYLLRQAAQENCDVVAFGTVEMNGAPVELRWWLDPSTGLFEAEDTTLAGVGLAFFRAQALAGTARVTFLGLPVGMGERFGVDFDLDGLYNLDELAWGTDPEDPDSDDDGFPDGHEVWNGGDPNDPGTGSNDVTPPTISNVEVLFVTNRAAKIQFQTDELTTFEATWTQGNNSGADASHLFEKHHTIVLTELTGDAKTHTVTITATDAGGLTTQASLDVTTLPHINPSILLKAASATEVQDSAGTLHYQVSGKARRKGGNLQAGRRMRVNVYVNGALTQELLEGTTSGNNGQTTVDVIENGLVPGDQVTVVVFDLWDVFAQFGGDWSMPDTLPEMRRFDLEYTGQGL